MDLLAFEVRRVHPGGDAEGPHGRRHAGRVLLRPRRYLHKGTQGGGRTQDHQAGELLVEADRTSVEDAGGPVKQAGARGLRRRRLLTAWLFMVPLLVINVLVILGPSVAMIYYSLTDWAGIGPAEFVGLQNYRDLLADTDFLMAIWQNILDPTRGIGSALASIGIPFLKGVSFFGSERLALPSIAFVNIWVWWGFILLLFLTALQSVDHELYEAARIDGAGRWQQFWNVTLPGIRPTFVFVVLLSIINSLLVFDYVYIITRGGPAGASEVVGTLMWKEVFERFEAGYAAAMGLALSFVSGLIVLIFVSLRRRGWEV